MDGKQEMNPSGRLGRRRRGRSVEIRDFILRTIPDHPGDVASIAAAHFQTSRRAINQNLVELASEGLVEPTGATRARRYRLIPIVAHTWRKDVTSRLSESEVWLDDIRPHLGGVPDNVIQVCQFGFTEMLNNVIDHSASPIAALSFKRTAIHVSMMIADDGIEIFRKVAAELGLDDERHAIRCARSPQAAERRSVMQRLASSSWKIALADDSLRCRAMANRCSTIVSDPQILGGTPVFRGTRVPVKALLDYLEGGHPLAEFLEDFPTVTEAQALSVLEHARALLDADASAAG